MNDTTTITQEEQAELLSPSGRQHLRILLEKYLQHPKLRLLNDGFQCYISALEASEAENVRLRERLESALDKIADIQENGEEEGACHACGICAGCPEDWQPTDDHNCRVMLELWADGEPLPWEAASRAVADSEVKG